MRALHIDIESYCDLDIAEVGMFKYIDHASFEIILFSYRFSDELFTTTIDLLNGEKIPEIVIEFICNEGIIKKAWNVFFEFTALRKYIAQNYVELDELRFINWRCTMTKAAYNGYPLKLESAGIALKLPMGKMAEGRALIKYFCVPVLKPSKKDKFAKRHLPNHDPDKWELFKKYNNQDVETEVEIDYMLPVDLPDNEYGAFQLDYQINSYGVMLDIPFIKQAIYLTNTHFADLVKQSKTITGLENPNSPIQLKDWLEEQIDAPVKSINAEVISKMIKLYASDSPIVKVLQIRQELSLSSVKKYPVMLRMAINGIMKGLVQFYGANRTGRYAGRGVQIQNLPKQGDYKPEEITFMRSAIKPHNNCESLAMMFSDVLAPLKTLLRTAFIPRPGKYFIIADWSAIEARILAWLSGCKWRMEVFATHGKIYEASVAKMMGLPLEAIKKPSKERDRGKVAELALGYQGWVPALIRMGALEMGIHPDELPNIAGTWRKENPEIAHKQYGLWAKCERAFRTAFEYPGKVIRFADERLTVQFKNRSLILTLPSGRQLFYPNAFIGPDKSINYYGIDQVNKKWKKTSLYGGKIVENVVQAIARDILVEGLKNISKVLNVVMHIHDEIVAEVPEQVEENHIKAVVENIMIKSPSWAKGLILKCDIFTSSYYRKN